MRGEGEILLLFLRAPGEREGLAKGKGRKGIRIRLQLILGIRGNDHGQDTEDQPLPR